MSDDTTMLAIVTTGVGGFERLEARRVPVPQPGPGEALLRVLAAGVNNTDVNTRVGWYDTRVSDDTAAAAAEARPLDAAQGWRGATPFPLIQGADCCGRVVAVGSGVDAALIGARALVRACMRPQGFGSPETVWLGSDLPGAFAQYVVAPASEVFALDTPLSDAELGAVPCAYGAAENMLGRAHVGPGARVLVTGASGGVGAAAVQLVALRGAEAIAVTSADKAEAVRALGAAHVLDRDADPRAMLGERSLDAVIDVVGGSGVVDRLGLLRRGGRMAIAGAIAGPIATLDLRRLYLDDLTLFGCTAWDAPVFPALIAHLAAGRLRPPVAATFPLERIAEAQVAFLSKRHVGKIVLIPPAPEV